MTRTGTYRPGCPPRLSFVAGQRACLSTTNTASLASPLTIGTFTRFAPLYFFQAYLLASVLLFAFGPLELRIDNPFTLYGYVLAGQAAIWIGYATGAKSRIAGYSQTIRFPTLAQGSILATLAVVTAAYRYRNYGGVSFLEALEDPSVAYYARLENYEYGETTSLAYSVLRGTSGPLLAMFIPIGIVYWSRMDRFWQAIWLVAFALYLGDSQLSGAAKGLFDIVLVLPWLIWIRTRLQIHSSQQARPRLRPSTSNTARYVLAGLVTIGVLIGGFRYFTHSRANRYGLGNDRGYPTGTTGWSHELYGVKIPESVEFVSYMVIRYWTHGYYALAGCLQLPFEWSYGVGHSVIWTKYAANLARDPDRLWSSCYPDRLEAATGYSRSLYWHTIYPWLASDLTFPGAIVFMGVMAYLFAQAWSESLRGVNPFALGFLTQVVLMFYYIPASNIRLMYAEEALAFWGLLIAWRLTRC